MKNRFLQVLLLLIATVIVFIKCGSQGGTNEAPSKEMLMKEFAKKNIYETQEQYGEHLVTIAACGDCHTPKKMGPRGPIFDSTRLLSGHPAGEPIFDINKKEIQSKGLVVTSDLTSWVGPWGVTFTANLTPDDTGIGTWEFNQFKNAIRNGKFHGLNESRDILPPMPWEMYRHMTDDELAAIFSYLKTIPPISNEVPPPLPPEQ